MYGAGSRDECPGAETERHLSGVHRGMERDGHSKSDRIRRAGKIYNALGVEVK